MTVLANLALPIGYLAFVVLVALLIGRFRVRREAQPTAPAPAAAMVPKGHEAAPAPAWAPLARDTRPEAPDDEEANLPRWLRPSVRTARFELDTSPGRRPPASSALLRAAPPLPPPVPAPFPDAAAPVDLDALFRAARFPRPLGGTAAVPTGDAGGAGEDQPDPDAHPPGPSSSPGG